MVAGAVQLDTLVLAMVVLAMEDGATMAGVTAGALDMVDMALDMALDMLGMVDMALDMVDMAVIMVNT